VYKIAALALCRSVETPDGRREIGPAEAALREGDIVALCGTASALAAGFVASYWEAIGAVAAALVRRTCLSGDEVAALVNAHRPAARG
jgi:hypothetical protein